MRGGTVLPLSYRLRIPQKFSFSTHQIIHFCEETMPFLPSHCSGKLIYCFEYKYKTNTFTKLPLFAIQWVDTSTFAKENNKKTIKFMSRNKQKKWIYAGLKDIYSSAEMRIIVRNTALLTPASKETIFLALLANRAFSNVGNLYINDDKFLRYIYRAIIFDLEEINNSNNNIIQ